MTVYNPIDVIDSSFDGGGNGLGGNFGAGNGYVRAYPDYESDNINFFELYASYTYGGEIRAPLVVNHLAFNYKINPDPNNNISETFSFPGLVLDYTPIRSGYPNYAAYDDDDFTYSLPLMTENNEVVFSFLRETTTSENVNFTLRVIITKHDGYVDVPPGEVGGNIGIKTLANWRVVNILEFPIFDTPTITSGDSTYGSTAYMLGNGNILIETLVSRNQSGTTRITAERFIILNQNFDLVNNIYEERVAANPNYSTFVITENNICRNIIPSSNSPTPITSILYDNNGNFINSRPFIQYVDINSIGRFSNGRRCYVEIDYSLSGGGAIYFKVYEIYKDNDGRYKIQNPMRGIQPGEDYGFTQFYYFYSSSMVINRKWYPIYPGIWVSNEQPSYGNLYYYGVSIVYINDIFMGYYRSMDFAYSKPAGGWNLGRITF